MRGELYERTITKEELASTESFALINSVRGWMRAKLVTDRALLESAGGLPDLGGSEVPPLPRTPSTYEGTCSRPPGTLKLARHPGARLFIGSGTVDDESRALRQSLLRSVADGIVGT